MTRDEVRHILGRLKAGTRSTQELGKATVALWTEELEDLSFDRAVKATGHLIRNQTWFPSIAEFLEAYWGTEAINMPAERSVDWLETKDGQKTKEWQLKVESMDELDYWEKVVSMQSDAEKGDQARGKNDAVS